MAAVDPDARHRDRFAAVYAVTYPALIAYARRRTSDPAEADDVVAEVYATAWRRRADLPATGVAAAGEGPERALPWLYGIAANVVRNSRRAGGRRLRLVERLGSQPPTGGAPLVPPPAGTGPGDAGDLRDALATLSFDDQEVLRLVAWEGLSHAEAGEALGCSANAVGIRIHRARGRLRAALDARAADDPRTDPDPRSPQHRGGAR